MPLPAPPDAVDPSATAFFLDFDGTLVEIAERPDAVVMTGGMRAVLSTLLGASGGAVAVVSGRELGFLDEVLKPLELPASGEHGRERRTAQGSLATVPVSAEAAQRLRRAVEDFAVPHDGLLVEVKGGSVALHYRQRPDLEAACLALADAIAAWPGIQLLRGKMVVEFKLSNRTKADAIAGFMAEPPFRGRRPVYVGDDVTDEDAFRWIAGHDGIAVKIGAGETVAGFRLESVAALQQWLARIAARSPVLHHSAPEGINS